jgi:DNA-binding GntR family transcriptional regulator
MDLRVEHQTLQRQAVEKLRNAILAGHFQPGDKLVEVRLCAMLGISRPSLREALRGLEAERLIEIIPNRGPQIPVVSWEQAEQIYQVRSLLEGEAAALSAVRATRDDIAGLEEACSAFNRAASDEDVVGCIAATSDFYRIILRCSGNSIIEQILSGLHARINFLRGKSMSLKGRTRFSLREMKAIVSGIKAKDPALARKAAAAHVEQARLAAKLHYEENASAPKAGRVSKRSRQPRKA